MDMTHSSSSHDQAGDPIKIHHPEEEEHHESRASKMLGKVKARAKKFKNSLTKHGNEHDHDVEEEEKEDENDEPEPEKHVAPVNEVSAVRSQPESFSDTNVPAPEEIVSSATRDSTAVYSSHDNKRVEPKPLRDATFEHEAPSYPVRTSDVSDVEDSRETHHVPLDTPVSLLSATEDVSTPGEDEFHGGQQEVNTERPKIPYHTQQGSGEDGLTRIAESPDQKSGLRSELESESGIGKDSPAKFGGESKTELGKDLPTRSSEFDQKTKSGLDNGPEIEPREDNPARSHEFDQKMESGVGGKSETLRRDDFPAKSHFDQKIESIIAIDSPTGFGEEPKTLLRDDFPTKSNDFDLKMESGTRNDSPTRFGGTPGTEQREDFQEKSHDFDHKTESENCNDSTTTLGGKPELSPRDDYAAKSHEFDLIESGSGGGKRGTGPREGFPAKSHEFDQKIESIIGIDSPTLAKDDLPGESHDFNLKAESETGHDSPIGVGGKPVTVLREGFPAKSHEFDQKIESIIGLDSPTLAKDDLPGESHDFNLKAESGTGHDSPIGVGGKPVTVLREGFPAKSHEFDQKIESIIGIDSPTGFGEKPETLPRDDFPQKNHDFDMKIESGTGDDLSTRFGGKRRTRPREDFLEKSHDFDQEIESGICSDSRTGFGENSETLSRDDFLAKSDEGTGDASSTRSGTKPGTVPRENFPPKSPEFEQTIRSEIGMDTDGDKPETKRGEDSLGKIKEFDKETESTVEKDSPTRLGGESGPDKNLSARGDDVKVETGLGRDLPTGTDDQFSPEFSSQKERNAFDSQYEAEEPKPSTYTEMIGSATSFVTDSAIATKNAAASTLGYSGETARGQHESPGDVETVAEKLTTDDENVKETVSPVTKKLPLSVGGNGAEETEQGKEKGVSTRDHLTEKLTPEEEDKSLSDMVAGKLNLGGGDKKTTTANEVEVAVEKIPSDKLPEEIEHSEAVAEEEKGGGGMVGKIKGAYNYWLGGTTEEVKPKSPVSVEESSQSLGSTVGTKGFSDSSESGLGETGDSTRAVPVQTGRKESGN